MSGFYCLAPKAIRSRPRNTYSPAIDPYGPSSPDFEERHRVTVKEVAGFQLETVGCTDAAPAPRSKLQAAADELAAVQAPASVSAGALKAPRERDWRDDYGVSRDR